MRYGVIWDIGDRCSVCFGGHAIQRYVFFQQRQQGFSIEIVKMHSISVCSIRCEEATYKQSVHREEKNYAHLLPLTLALCVCPLTTE